MRTIADIEVFENIPILVRAALNVPIEHGSVMNDYRLRRALPTIQYLRERGARVILISHLGEQGTETLEPVARALGKLITGVSFFGETIGPRARARVREMTAGQILVMENLRRDRGEKNNDHTFATEVAALGDIFVQDSFDTCHREHASIVTLPTLLPSYAGLLLADEVQELTSALQPSRPSLAIIGGAKFSTKEPVLSALLKSYDHVYVGGALANDFMKASGLNVGKSLTSESDPRDIKKMLANHKLVLPVDTIVVPEKTVGTPLALAKQRVAPDSYVQNEEVIMDQGPGTLALLSELAQKAKTILWNGPLGKYEDGFIETTNGLARAVASSKAHSIIGGGDTIAAIENLHLLPRFSFVSTGGGAMLDFLAYGTLPGVEILDKYEYTHYIKK